MVLVFDWSYMAKEWCDKAGVAATPIKIIPNSAPTNKCLIIKVLTASSLFIRVSTESLQLLGFFPSLFEMRFPILRPWPPEVIDIARIAGDQLRWLAVGSINDRALYPALHESEPGFGIIKTRPKLPRRDGV